MVQFEYEFETIEFFINKRKRDRVEMEKENSRIFT